MKRSKHSLSHYKLATFDMGQLVPVGLFEVLPGDSVQQATSALVRVSPLNAPVMHPVQVRIHHWYVPFRLIWEDWEDFITGGPDGEDASVFPTVVAGGGGFAAGKLHDYFGVPPGVAGLEVSALPFRAYTLIYSEFYRDQDLQSVPGISVASGVDNTTNTDVARVAWEKDYFTSARPWPQKGADITLPLGVSAPLNITGNGAPTFDNLTDGVSALTSVGGVATVSKAGGPASVTANLNWADPKLTGTADLSGATSVDVNTVRRAFALQRYQEARAQYGSRYTEYLRYLGVRSSDARLQRPEYLGGGKQTIAFSEVLQTAPTSDGDDELGIGNLKGHGISAMRSRRYRRFFEEHGLVLSLMSVRPRSMYADGVHRSWLRRTREDFWQRELEQIGQQEVSPLEVYAGAADPETPFGYQDRYADYRHLPSTIAGEFRTTLDFWHMARLFGSEPGLNSDFITCEPDKRINQVGGTAHQLWCMINHSIQARRLVSQGGRPGRIV